MQARSSDENTSVCLSANRVDCDKTEEKSVQIFTLYERSFSIVFWGKNGWWGDPFYLKFWVNRPPLERNRRFEQIIACNASAVTPSKKSSINTNRKSLRAFQWALDERRTVRCP